MESVANSGVRAAFAALLALLCVLVAVLSIRLGLQLAEVQQWSQAARACDSVVRSSQIPTENASSLVAAADPDPAPHATVKADQADHMPAVLDAVAENSRLIRDISEQLSELADRLDRPALAPPDPQALASLLPTFSHRADPETGTFASVVANPARMMRWRQQADPKTVQYVESVLRQHSLDARSRIEAEADPANPDPAVIRRIMAETNDAIASDLEGIWLFDDMEGPARVPGMPWGPSAGYWGGK